MPLAQNILVVDDHAEFRELVSTALRGAGYGVSTADSGSAMRRRMAQDEPVDLVLLDIMMPGEDGLALCKALRRDSDIPIIMLTAKGDEMDRVRGLELGADDYLPKPFGSRELIARIRAVLRRSRDKAGPARRHRSYTFGRWTLDSDTRSLLRQDGVLVPLSAGEYDLLLALVERPQRILSRSELLDLTGGADNPAFDRSIDTQVSRLRKKLEVDPASPGIIKTVWGGGYMFTAAVAPK